MGKAIHSTTKTRKEDILKAALDCFTDAGYIETGIADICNSSGASVGSVYHHFGSKEQIASALYIEGIMDYQNGLLEALENEADPEAGVKRVVEYHLQWVEKNINWARFLFQKRHESFMENAEKGLTILNRDFAARISNWFLPHIKEGHIQKMKLDMYIAILLGPCQEYARLYMSGKTVSDIKNAIKNLGNAAWISLSV